MPFGETLVDEHLNSNNSPFRFNAKELDEATGNYYYGARYYNPKWSTWLSVDPLAEEAPGWTPYRYGFNNPINNIDPNGLWEASVNDDGSTSYIREDGDDASTLANQYGLEKDVADELYASMEDGAVSGQAVIDLTGSEVLKLDDFSDPQKNLEHTMFAAHYSQKNNPKKGAFEMMDYFELEGKPMLPLKLDGELSINGVDVRVKGELLTHQTKNASIMGFSQTGKSTQYISYAYGVGINEIDNVTATRMGRRGKQTNHKIKSYLNINGNLKDNTYNILTTLPQYSERFVNYFEKFN